MPFQREDLEQVFKDHVIKAAEMEHLTVKRGDDFFSEHSIITDIWAAINSAKLIIAECTGRNPNVFYELGIAHTLGKRAVTITQDEADIPFDIRHWRYIKYDFTPRGMSKFEQDLRDAIRKLSEPKTRRVL
jgi:hypothetical protein